MAKKFGKFLMTTAALGAIAASAYYFFWKKDAELDDDYDEGDYDRRSSVHPGRGEPPGN